MNESKKIKAKSLYKHEIEANWLKSSYVPKESELVIYEVEVDENGTVLELPAGRTRPITYPRIKMGDGHTNVNNLPFFAYGGMPTLDEVNLKSGRIREYFLKTDTEVVRVDGLSIAVPADKAVMVRAVPSESSAKFVSDFSYIDASGNIMPTPAGVESLGNLKIPVVTLDRGAGQASWPAVPGAEYYEALIGTPQRYSSNGSYVDQYNVAFISGSKGAGILDTYPLTNSASAPIAQDPIKYAKGVKGQSIPMRQGNNAGANPEYEGHIIVPKNIVVPQGASDAVKQKMDTFAASKYYVDQQDQAILAQVEDIIASYAPSYIKPEACQDFDEIAAGSIVGRTIQNLTYNLTLGNNAADGEKAVGDILVTEADGERFVRSGRTNEGTANQLTFQILKPQETTRKLIFQTRLRLHKNSANEWPNLQLSFRTPKNKAVYRIDTQTSGLNLRFSILQNPAGSNVLYQIEKYADDWITLRIEANGTSLENVKFSTYIDNQFIAETGVYTAPDASEARYTISYLKDFRIVTAKNITKGLGIWDLDDILFTIPQEDYTLVLKENAEGKYWKLIDMAGDDWWFNLPDTINGIPVKEYGPYAFRNIEGARPEDEWDYYGGIWGNFPNTVERIDPLAFKDTVIGHMSINRPPWDDICKDFPWGAELNQQTGHLWHGLNYETELPNDYDYAICSGFGYCSAEEITIGGRADDSNQNLNGFVQDLQGPDSVKRINIVPEEWNINYHYTPYDYCHFPYFPNLEEIHVSDLSVLADTGVEDLFQKNQHGKRPKLFVKEEKVQDLVFKNTYFTTSFSGCECNKITLYDCSCADSQFSGVNAQEVEIHGEVSMWIFAYSAVRTARLYSWWPNGDGWFSGCEQLSHVELGAPAHGRGYDVYIPYYAFYNCRRLKNITIPYGVVSIGQEAFAGTCGLERVVFEGTPNEIASDAFNINVRTMYVPWKDGEVSGAPWGATNATIYYEVGSTNSSNKEETPQEFFEFVENYSGYTCRGLSDLGRNSLDTASNIVIPSYVNTLPVTALAANAFSGAQFASITLPTTLETAYPGSLNGTFDVICKAIPNNPEIFTSYGEMSEDSYPDGMYLDTFDSAGASSFCDWYTCYSEEGVTECCDGDGGHHYNVLHSGATSFTGTLTVPWTSDPYDTMAMYAPWGLDWEQIVFLGNF